MKKKISVLLMVLVMVLSATVTSYAAVGDEVINPKSTVSVDFIIGRTSGTSADVTVTTNFSGEASQYSVVVYLQKLVNGSWINDTTNDEYVFYNNGFNSFYCVFENTYSSLTYGTTYRLMVVSRDVQGNTEYRYTTYSNQF